MRSPRSSFHNAQPSSILWIDTALWAMVPHNDSVSIARCVALVALSGNILGLQSTSAAKWWVEAFVETARELELDKTYLPRGGAFRDYTGPLWRLVDQYVPAAFDQGQRTPSIHSGAYLLETIPSSFSS